MQQIDIGCLHKIVHLHRGMILVSSGHQQSTDGVTGTRLADYLQLRLAHCFGKLLLL